MWKQTDQDLWVTITDTISWALIEQNRLNRNSPSGLLLKWGINPSTSLKCAVTDSGKLLSAGLFACLLPPRLPNLPCGKALIKRSGVSSPVTVDTIMFYKGPNNVWRQSGERGLGAAVKWYETVFHLELWMSRTKTVDFGKLHLRGGHYCSLTTVTSITAHFTSIMTHFLSVLTFNCIWFRGIGM